MGYGYCEKRRRPAPKGQHICKRAMERGPFLKRQQDIIYRGTALSQHQGSGINARVRNTRSMTVDPARSTMMAG